MHTSLISKNNNYQQQKQIMVLAKVPSKERQFTWWSYLQCLQAAFFITYLLERGTPEISKHIVKLAINQT